MSNMWVACLQRQRGLRNHLRLPLTYQNCCHPTHPTYKDRALRLIHINNISSNNKSMTHRNVHAHAHARESTFTLTHAAYTHKPHTPKHTRTQTRIETNKCNQCNRSTICLALHQNNSQIHASWCTARARLRRRVISGNQTCPTVKATQSQRPQPTQPRMIPSAIMLMESRVPKPKCAWNSMGGRLCSLK